MRFDYYYLKTNKTGNHAHTHLNTTEKWEDRTKKTAKATNNQSGLNLLLSLSFEILRYMQSKLENDE